jgi:hypothetical protein
LSRQCKYETHCALWPVSTGLSRHPQPPSPRPSQSPETWESKPKKVTQKIQLLETFASIHSSNPGWLVDGTNKVNYLLRRDRAKQRSWRSPTLKFSPFSVTTLSSPASKLPIFLLKCTLATASLISASLCCSNGSRFNLTVPLNSTGSCNSTITR